MSCHDHEPLMRKKYIGTTLNEAEPIRIRLERRTTFGDYSQAPEAFVCRHCGAVYFPYKERLL